MHEKLEKFMQISNMLPFILLICRSSHLYKILALFDKVIRFYPIFDFINQNNMNIKIENNQVWLKISNTTWCLMQDVNDWKYWIRRFKNKGLRKICNNIKKPIDF